MSQPPITLDDLSDLVRRQLGVREVSAEAELRADLGAESIDIQNLVSAMEERYGVVFEDDELETIVTVGDLFELVRSRA